MKILHIVNGIGVGGIATFIEELLEDLSKEHEVTLVCLEKNIEKYREEKLKDVNVIFFNQSNMYSLKNIFRLRKLIKENDIIHSHLFPAQYITVIASLFLNKKIITTEHTAWNNRRKYFIFKVIDKIFYIKYNKIIGVSDAVKNNLINWIGMKEKVIAIPNGVDLEKYKNSKNIRNELWNLKETDKLICMIARFSKQKDQKTLINAIKILPNEIKCIFVGIGETLEDIKEYVKINDLGERIKFLGYRSDIKDILKSCDLSILSTNYEGFPFVVLESLASTTIFIGSKVCGIMEIFDDNKFLFENGNEKELAQKIEMFIYDKKLIEESKEKINEIIQNYSLEKMIEEYKKIYLED